MRSLVCGLAIAALAMAGCGSSSTTKKNTTTTATTAPAPTQAPSLATFKQGYIALRPRVNAVGTELVLTLQNATKLTYAQLAARLRSYAARTTSALRAARMLRPPANLSGDFGKALGGLGRFASDLQALARVVAARNAASARRDLLTLRTDLATLTQTGAVLRARLGIPAR